MEIKDEVLRCSALFETTQGRLEGPETRVLGAIKEIVFEDPDLTTQNDGPTPGSGTGRCSRTIHPTGPPGP